MFVMFTANLRGSLHFCDIFHFYYWVNMGLKEGARKIFTLGQSWNLFAFNKGQNSV